jgi:hypothetical protein
MEAALYNSRIGQLATICVASLSMTVATEAYVAEPVAAENTLSPTSTRGTAAVLSEQKCANVAERAPKVKHALHMVYAGIRPFTGFRHSQATVGAFEYPDMPESCAPNMVRGVVGRIQMLRDGHWVQIENETVGGWTKNDGGVARVIVAPTHADPGFDYVFNDCVDGKFHDVRIEMQARLRDGTPKKIVGEKEYIFQVSVQGNCTEAARSKRIAEEQQKSFYG